MAYYVFDDAKNLFEGMTKEEIIAAIAQATGVTPENIDDGFITTIQEQNAQHGVKLWVGSQNEYNAIQQPDANTLYVVTDPHETNELQSQINQLQSEVDNIVAASTTNATGYVIQKLESDPLPLEYNSTYQYYAATNWFPVPEGSVILDYSWRRTGNTDKRIDDLAVVRESETLVRMRHYTQTQEVSATFILTLVISYPQPITLPELTDIRVGYDGTVYGSAGEAVRKQAFDTRFHDYIKQALLNLLAHVAYTDQNGQQYYNELEAAMYMMAGVTSITAVFDQGQNVIYDTDDLDTLRQYLTVTAYFEDNTNAVITGYLLDGLMYAGQHSFNVTFAGKTAEFTANISSIDYTNPANWSLNTSIYTARRGEQFSDIQAPVTGRMLFTNLVQLEPGKTYTVSTSGNYYLFVIVCDEDGTYINVPDYMSNYQLQSQTFTAEEGYDKISIAVKTGSTASTNADVTAANVTVTKE